MTSDEAKDGSMVRLGRESNVLLNDIISMTEILMDESLSAEQMKYVRMIRFSAGKLWALLHGKSNSSQAFATESKAGAATEDDEPCCENIDNLAQSPRVSGHVLVAEDNKTNQVAMKMMLEKLGLEVTIANNGHEVLEQIQQQSFDLIFMDIQMPCLDGLNTTRTLREQGVDVPIVVVTGQTMKHSGEECIRAGCDDYLAKPVTRAKLQMIINTYLREPNLLR